MRIARLRLRGFRCYEEAEVEINPSLTVVHGANGAGKTSLLEGLYFGCTGRSCRTASERAVIRFGADHARVVVELEGEDGRHELAVAVASGSGKRAWVDGAAVERVTEASWRPLVAVFLPSRLELVAGPPAHRRAHMDQLVAAMWPARREARLAYARALAQRNALLGRIRSGRAGSEALGAWDAELARCGIELRDNREAAIARVQQSFMEHATALGLDGDATVLYRPRTRAATAEELMGELAQRAAADIERGSTGHGPHRDELVFQREGHELRAYGSQGQQRLALLALLLAERSALAAERGSAPVLLLDDVMSELDAERRERLAAVLRDGAGQAIVTATELEHVPGSTAPGVGRLAVAGGRILAAKALAA